MFKEFSSFERGSFAPTHDTHQALKNNMLDYVPTIPYNISDVIGGTGDEQTV